MKDNADKISAESKRSLEAAANAVKEALKGNDSSPIKTASEKLNAVWQTVSAELYKTAGDQKRPANEAAGGPAGPPPEAEPMPNDHTPEKEPVIDAEVVNDK